MRVRAARLSGSEAAEQLHATLADLNTHGGGDQPMRVLAVIGRSLEGKSVFSNAKPM